MSSLPGWVVVMTYGMMCCSRDYICMSFIALFSSSFLNGAQVFPHR